MGLNELFKIVNLNLSTIFRNSEKIFFSRCFPCFIPHPTCPLQNKNKKLHEFRDVFILFPKLLRNNFFCHYFFPQRFLFFRLVEVETVQSEEAIRYAAYLSEETF